MNRAIVSKWQIAVLVAIGALISVVVALVIGTRAPPFYFEVSMRSSEPGNAQVFYDIGRGINAADSTTARLPGGESMVRLPLPAGEYRAIRFDPIDRGDCHITIHQIRIIDLSGRVVRPLSPEEFIAFVDLSERRIANGEIDLKLNAGESDPSLGIVLPAPLALWPTALPFWLFAIKICLLCFALFSAVAVTWSLLAARHWTANAMLPLVLLAFIYLGARAMNPLFLWFGAHPPFFYLIALAALFSFVTLAVWNRQPADERIELAFLGGIFATLFAWRWPIFLVPLPLNPDEATFAAGALKALVDFAPWRGFNAGTSGPLNVYILALPALFGAPITFVSVRIIATCLLGATMLALYYAVKWTHGARVGRLALVPPVVFLALTTDGDFVHYSSEHLSICLITIVLAASAYLAKQEASLASRVTAGAVAGFCIGSTLFAKLQAVPLALLVFIFAAGALVPLWKRSRNETVRVGLAMVAALCAVPAAILLSLCWTGELRDAYFSYIQMNLNYLDDGSQDFRLVSFLENSAFYDAFLFGSLLILLLGAIALIWRRNINARALFISAASVLLLFTALYVIYKPHRIYPHYLFFSIVPLSFCVANVLGLTREAGFWKDRDMRIALLSTALFVLPAFSVAMASGNRYLKDLTYNVTHRSSAVAMAISRYIKPGEPMCVWGWASVYHVQTGTYPATRELETPAFIGPGPYNRFRPRYLSEIKRNKPVVFVDAAAPNEFVFKDRATQGHETFPELAAYIRDNYVLRDEVSGVRIYVVKTR